MKRLVCNAMGAMFVLFCGNAWAANRVYLPDAGASQGMELSDSQSQPSQGMETSDKQLRSKLGLAANEGLELIRSRTGKNNVVHYRFRQTYKQVPVWGYHVLVAKDGTGGLKSLHGSKWNGLELEVPSVEAPPSFTAEDALVEMQELHFEMNTGISDEWVFENESSEKVIFMDENGVALLCYAVSFFSDTPGGGNPSQRRRVNPAE